MLKISGVAAAAALAACDPGGGEANATTLQIVGYAVDGRPGNVTNIEVDLSQSISWVFNQTIDPESVT